MKKIAMVGLGRMGGNMARRLRQGGAEVAAYNRNFAVAHQLAAETGLVAAETLQQLVDSLGEVPRIIWLMLPAGEATQQALETLIPMLGTGDIVVDGANAFYKDSQRRAEELGSWGIQFVDVGVSGGVWGLQNGYAMMIGGEPAAVKQLEYFLKILAPAPDKGWLHCGPAGAGHYVKMIHNGIEYGMMQAFAEGFALMKGKPEFDLDLAAIAEMWRHGSVVRSWLLDLSADFLQQDQDLDAIAPFVPDSGEGRWTAFEAIEQGVPAPVMSLALMMRFASQGANDFPARMLAMMRKGFGGHGVKEGAK
ncbi:MAG: 6-phosphogluconate dehydrogenase (decarboxylating) [Nitrosomonadales bacterium]|nr:MAG: 6-phosphogluconate dehydrogenase (decarboxylating) [Nitrosomonadales bacterium]